MCSILSQCRFQKLFSIVKKHYKKFEKINHICGISGNYTSKKYHIPLIKTNNNIKIPNILPFSIFSIVAGNMASMHENARNLLYFFVNF